MCVFSRKGALFFLFALGPLSAAAKEDKKWRQLGVAAVGDLGSASLAALGAAPMIATIDRAIVEATAKGVPVVRSFGSCAKESLARPGRFLLSSQYRWIVFVYASTYCTHKKNRCFRNVLF